MSETALLQGSTAQFDLWAWRTKSRRLRSFGLRAEPMPALDGATAQALAKQSYDDSWGPLGPSREEYLAEVSAIWAAAETPTQDKISPTVRKLLDRDGEDCWFCGDPLGRDRTLEHKVPKSRGGTDDLANLALAHRSCNQLLGNAPLHIKEAARAREAHHLDQHLKQMKGVAR